MTDHDWTFPAQVTRVVDGDTLDVRADTGFRTYAEVRVRLDGVDTAEIYGVPQGSEEYVEGIHHKEFVQGWLTDREAVRWPYTLRTARESGKYGRWIGDVTDRATGEALTDALVAAYPEVQS